MAKTIASKVRDLFPEGLHCDRVICKKDGTFEMRSGYFYRHGRTAEKFRGKIVRVFTAAGWCCTVVGYGDEWREWPKDSYFWVRVRFSENIAGGEG